MKRGNEKIGCRELFPASPTCSILLIGDELLSGRTEDKNFHHIALEVAKIGVNLQEVRVVPDVEEEIISAVNALRNKYTYVFTTGGIGPTHDDITALSIAKAFGVEMYRDEKTVKAFEKFYHEKGYTEVNEASLKMADFPVGSELIPNPITTAPGFKMGNVFVMAGIPRVMQIMLEYIIPHLKKGKPVKTKSVDIAAGESVISKAFEEIQRKYIGKVSLGSYPFKNGEKYCTSLVLRSDDAQVLNAAFEDVEIMLKHLNIEKIQKNT